jgi:membrane associated rhomboid family serine protease
MHLGGNMLYLWIFGDNVEESMGHGRFLAFYFGCGAAAGLAQALVDPSSPVPMIGASGAIAGVLGAYIVLHPHANVRVLIWILVFIRLIWVPAGLVLGLWFLMQIVSGAFSTGEEGGVAFWAHAGGFVAGVILVPLFKRASVPLFGARRTTPFTVMERPRRGGGSVPSSGRQTPPERRGWPYE